MNQRIHNRGNPQTSSFPKWWRSVALTGAFAILGASCAAQAPPGEIAVEASPSFDVLVLARKNVQEYFDKFSDLTCKESVTQYVLNGSGHAIYRENSAYDYQFQAANSSGAFKFSETREVRNPSYRDPGRTLLVTSGFASLLATKRSTEFPIPRFIFRPCRARPRQRRFACAEEIIPCPCPARFGSIRKPA
jgi:hypothetical protein